MRNEQLARLVSDWSHNYDEAQRAQWELDRRRDALKIACEKLAESQARVLHIAKEFAPKQESITMRTWKDHVVVINLRANTVGVGLAVDKD